MPGKRMKILRATKGHLTETPMSTLPSFNLDAKDLPAIKNWKVGSRYKLGIEVEQVSMSKDEYREGQITSRFRIRKLKDLSHSSHKEKKGRRGY